MKTNLVLRWLGCLALVVTGLLAVWGCGHHGSTAIKELRFAVFPPDDAQAASDRYEEFRATLEKAVGMPVKLVLTSDYSGTIEAMKAKKIELGEFGPLSYVLAKREANAEAFAGMAGKTGGGIYHSVFMVRADSPYKSLEDLKGKRIALVDPASTSGSLMPHYLTFKNTGVDLEQFFGKVDYAGTHPSAVRMLVNGTVDVCGVEENVDRLMQQAGQIPNGSTRVILTSQDLPPSPYAYRRDLDPELKKKIKDCILAMKPRKPAKGQPAIDHHVPVTDDMYKLIEDLVDELKLKRQAILKK